MISGAVLSGGRSSRMGSDKAFLLVSGTPLAARTATTLANGGCAPVRIVGRNPRLAELGFELISDSESLDFHPLFGVCAALAAASEPLVFIAPCDVVNLESSHVEALIAFGAPCVAEVNGSIHPLVAVLPQSMQAQALEFAQANRSARDFVANLPSVSLPPPTLRDVNQLSDLTR